MELTEEQLLEYAKKNYPLGTKFYPAHLPIKHCFNNDACIVDCDFINIEQGVQLNKPYNSNTQAIPNVYYCGKWAEIVTEKKNYFIYN